MQQQNVEITFEPKTRQSFDILATLDLGDTIKAETERCEEAFDAPDVKKRRYELYGSIPKTLRGVHIDRYNWIFSTIAESLIETSRVLQIEVPDFEFSFRPSHKEVDGQKSITEATYKGSRSTGRSVISLNEVYIRELLTEHELFGFTIGRRKIQDEIRNTIAHEAFHCYIMNHYPATDERIIEAGKSDSSNRLIDSGRYENDRGEKAADAFGRRYVQWKRAHR